ncbi:MAG: DUF2142 domain-containing protein [Desulforhopalus sp.]
MSSKNSQVQNKKSKRNRIIKVLTAVLVCVLACGLYYHFFVAAAFVEIELEVTQKSEFKIYWAKPGEPFSEQRMSVVRVTPDTHDYSFFLTDISKVDKIRIDTHTYIGTAILKKILFQQEGWETIDLSSPEAFYKLKPLNDIADFNVSPAGILINSSGKDSNFELAVTPVYQGLDIFWLLLRLLFITVLTLLFVFGGSPLIKELRFVPLLMFGVFVLVVVMASVSKRNSHPDEYVHMNAVAYYQDNWLPPLVEDPAIRDSYSVYGVSRLNNSEVYYLPAGKFYKFVQSIKLTDALSLRMFNLVLFGLIVLYTIKYSAARMVALPFLVSPQLWYLFSYCNSDAFALFIAFLVGCQLVDRQSLLHRFLKGEDWSARVGGLVALPLLLGLLFLLKKNYYPYIVFFYLCIGMKIFWSEEYYWEKKEAIVRMLVITVIGLAIFGLRIGADYMVNGVDREEKMAVLQEETALPLYKASTELDQKHISLSRKARGVTLEDVIVKDRWFEHTFRSSFGVFGYFTISGPQIYYDLIRWSGACLLLFVVGSIALRGGLSGAFLALTTVGFSAALIAASVHHSWAVDFQAQGRYLFPIVPMLGILYGLYHKFVNIRVLVFGVFSMYLFGVYGFVFQALLRIPKVY